MLTVTLYEFKKRENSTKRPDASATQREHQAVLKMPTSLLRPEITFDFGLKGNPSFYNYAYISDLGNRYYFIRDWTVSEGHLWTAHMEVDVLASWKISIGESTQYVLRSSNSFDTYVMDKMYVTKAPITTVIKTVENWPIKESIGGGNYVVGVINNSNNAVGAVAYYVFTEVQFRAFMAYLLGSIDWAGTIDEISADLTKVLFNPMQYISSVTWYPTNAPKGSDVNSIPFGWWNIPVKASMLKTSGVVPEAYIITLPKHPQASSRGKYLNLAPYTTYDFDSRVWGLIPIDTSTLIDEDALTMEVRTDYATGVSNLRIERGSDHYAVAVRQGMYGVPIQIAQIGIDYINATLTTVKTTAEAASELTSTKNMVDMATNPISATAGSIATVAGAIQTTLNAYMPQFSTSGNNGTVANYMVAPTLYAKFAPLVDEDNDDRGRPYCKKAVLSTLPGYQVISCADIALASTKSENQMVKQYMESGYFYE